MSLDTCINTIENPYFTMNYSVISGFSHFLSCFKRDETLIELTTCLQHDPDAVAAIDARLRKLLFHNPQPEYLHQHDIQIAAYLYVLSQVEVPVAQKTLAVVLWIPNLFWAKRLARHLKETLSQPTEL